MGKKKYFGMVKNDKANMPQDVVHSKYPERDYAVMEGGYVDTQPELDRADRKMKSKVRRGMDKY